MSATKTEKIHERVVQRRALHRSSGTLFVDPPQKIKKKKKKKPSAPPKARKKKKKKPLPPPTTSKNNENETPAPTTSKKKKKKTPPAPMTFGDVLKKIQEEGKKLGINNRKGMTGDKVMKLKF